MTDGGRKTCRVGFWVVVEVDAYEHEAAAVAQAAAQFPFSRHWPREVSGEVNGKTVTGRLVYSTPLMTIVAEDET